MKFQNPSLNFFLNGQADTRTHRQTDKPKPICSPLFQSLGHNYHQISSNTHLISSSASKSMSNTPIAEGF